LVNVTVDDLLEIPNRNSSSKGIVQQDGGSFKGTNRPNPTRQINVTDQVQLEAPANLGPDLEIPDGEAITILIDDSFTLTKPFKIGLGSTIEVRPSTVRTTLTYTGPGALFQHLNPANDIRSILVRDIDLRGDGNGDPGNGTNSIVDLKGATFIVFTDVQMSHFGSIGASNFPASRFNGCSQTNINQGLAVTDPLLFGCEQNIITQFIETRFTLFSFIINASGPEISIDKITPFSLFPNSALLYVPPTSPVGTQLTINRSLKNNGEIFQQGTDIAINEVIDTGNGKATFGDLVPHDLVVGKVITLSGFAESTYNGTFRVTVVINPTAFEVGIDFVTDESGTMNAKSLDETDIFVLTQANTGVPDSMFTGESGLEIFGSEVTSSSLIQNAFEVITSASWLSAGLERFEEGVVNTGQLICNDPDTKRYAVAYSATLEKDGGGSLNVGIVILKNGVNVAFNPPHTVNTGKVQITGTDIIELSETDTLDIAVINFDISATAIIISQASLVTSRA